MQTWFANRGRELFSPVGDIRRRNGIHMRWRYAMCMRNDVSRIVHPKSRMRRKALVIRRI